MKKLLILLLVLLPGLCQAQQVVTQYQEDAHHYDKQLGQMCLAVREDTPLSTSNSTGDYSALTIDAYGRLYITGEHSEDVAAVSGDPGVFALTQRKDVAASTATTDGDYAGLITDATGKLWVTGSTGGGTEYAEDTGHVSGDLGGLCLAVRKDNSASTSGADGDYSALTLNALGQLYVAGEYDEDAAAVSGDKGMFVLTQRKDAAASTATANGDYAGLITDANGKLWVTGSVGSGTEYAEDTAHVTADLGTLSLAVRKDNPASTATTDGDYAAFTLDALGQLRITGEYAEDAAAVSGDYGMSALAVRRNTAVSSTATADDYATINTDQNGKLWANATLQTSVIGNNGTERTISFAVLVAAAAGDTTVVAADAVYKIRVLAYTIVCAAPVGIYWESDGTAITGVSALAANGGISADCMPFGCFETAVNKALLLVLDDDVQCGGHITYAKVL